MKYATGYNLKKRSITEIIREYGFKYSIRAIFRITIIGFLIYINPTLVKRTLLIDNTEISYLRPLNFFNSLRIGERVVEIPIIQYLYMKEKPANVLEIGNVTSQWFHIPNLRIVDKYEIGENIINEDIDTFESNNKYDMIISISTIEHIGFDEEHKDPDKPFRVINKLVTLLKEHGTLIITVPLNYNPSMDLIIKNHIKLFSNAIFLRRISEFNNWMQVSYKDTLNLKYDSKYLKANAIAILIVGNLSF